MKYSPLSGTPRPTDQHRTPHASHQQDNKLHLTSLSSLLVWAAVAAFCTWLMVSSFYSTLATFTVWVSVPVIVLTVADGVLALYVHRAIEGNKVGQDRHQLHPLHVARLFVLGRASAFAGAIFCGVGVGSGIFVWPRVQTLAAAAADSPGIIVFTVAGALLAVVGVLLERACRVPPDQVEQDTAGAPV